MSASALARSRLERSQSRKPDADASYLQYNELKPVPDAQTVPKKVEEEKERKRRAEEAERMIKDHEAQQQKEAEARKAGLAEGGRYLHGFNQQVAIQPWHPAHQTLGAQSTHALDYRPWPVKTAPPQPKPAAVPTPAAAPAPAPWAAAAANQRRCEPTSTAAASWQRWELPARVEEPVVAAAPRPPFDAMTTNKEAYVAWPVKQPPPPQAASASASAAAAPPGRAPAGTRVMQAESEAMAQYKKWDVFAELDEASERHRVDHVDAILHHVPFDATSESRVRRGPRPALWPNPALQT